MVRTRIVHAVVLAGRRIQPAAFAITLAAISLALTYIGEDRVPGPFENILGIYAIGVATILTLGWALNNHRLMRAGLLTAVAMWAFTAWIAATGLGALTSFLLALSWLVLSAGSYWLEEVDAHSGNQP